MTERRPAKRLTAIAAPNGSPIRQARSTAVKLTLRLSSTICTSLGSPPATSCAAWTVASDRLFTGRLLSGNMHGYATMIIPSVASNHSPFIATNETCTQMPNMRLLPGLAWELSDDPPTPLDPRLLPLLRAAAETGSLAAAVADRGLSYRAAWGLLRAYQRKLGEPLVVLERGRGASLALLGERLVGADGSARRRLARTCQRIALELGAPADVKHTPVPRLTVA